MPYKIITCPDCKNEFKPSSRHKICPKCRAEKRKVPCPKCGNLKQNISSLCKNCNPHRLDKNGNWKGGKTRHHAGYVMLKVDGWHKNNGYKFEHIVVMENHLGRQLFDGENIHHINGIKDDNRIENLELWIRPQPAGIRIKDAVSWAKDILDKYEKLVD